MWRLKNLGQASGWDIQELRRNLDALVRAELIDREPSGQVTLTALGQFAGESGIEIRSVVRVSSALRFVPEELSGQDLVLLAQVTVEMDDIYIPANSRSRQEAARWPQTAHALGCSASLINGLHIDGGAPMKRAKRAVACLRYISPSPMQAIEAELTQHMRPTGTAGAIRSAASRTRDVLGAVAQVSLFRGHSLMRDDLADSTALLLETGAPTAMLEVAKELGNALTRAEYLGLLSRDITAVQAVLDAEPGDVSGLMDSDRLSEVQSTLRDSG
jgi:hypothetical protein